MTAEISFDTEVAENGQPYIEGCYRPTGEDLIAERYAGLVVSSFAPGAWPAKRNVVFWRWSTLIPHKVLVIDDKARLPKDGRSWEP